MLRRRTTLCLALLLAGVSASIVDAQTSRAIWEKRIVHAPAIAPVLSGDTLWVVGTERKIHSMAAASGKRHWRRNLPGPAVTPVVPLGRSLFIGLGPPSRALVALDRQDGRERWAVRLDGVPVAITPGSDGVIVAMTAGGVQAFAGADGAAGWKRVLGRPIAGIARAGGRLFVLARSDSLWCLDPHDGSIKWATATQSIHAAPPTVIDSIVLSIAYDGVIVARRASDGMETARATARSPQIAPVAGADGALATAATGGEVETFHLPTLERGWVRDTGETVSCGTVSWGDWWVIPAQGGRVLAVTRARGVDAWDLKLRAAVFLPPAANHDYLALIDERGRVMVYRLDRPS